MALTSSLPSAVILKWPVTFDVTLEIDPKRIGTDATVGIVGLRLVHMGGKLVAWTPDFHRRPAIARFEFASAGARGRFIAGALEIPGVSITAS